MYKKHYIVLIAALCAFGQSYGRNETDPQKDTIFEQLGDDFILGNRPQKIGSLNYVQIQVDQEEGSNAALSGYHALKNAFLTKGLLDSQSQDRQKVALEFKNSYLSESLFGTQKGLWRSQIIDFRRKEVAALYLRDLIVQRLLNCTKIENCKNLFAIPLYTEKAKLLIDKAAISSEQFQNIRAICMLAKKVAQDLINSQYLGASENQESVQEDHYTITHDALMESFVKVWDEEKKEVSPLEMALISLKTREDFEAYFTHFETQSFTVKTSGNNHELLVNGNVFYTKTYGPSSDDNQDQGGWLFLSELIEIAQKEKNDSSRMFHEEFTIPFNIHTFDFSEGGSSSTKRLFEESIETIKTASTFTTSALLFLESDNRWFSCVLAKLAGAFWVIVTDSSNKDRRNDPLVNSLVKALEKKEPKKEVLNLKDFLEKGIAAEKKDKEKEEPANYDAPNAGIPLEELPSLEDLLGEKIPNDMLMILNQLKKSPDLSKQKLNKLKNGLILYGPPGTGKTTIAEVMARIAGREVLFAGGGDFRTAYQGSSKAKLDDLFRAAKELGKPCVVIIDEIDGTASKLQPQGSTQEDNRAIKVLLTILEKYRNDPSIFVICTTNYIENLEPSIRRRFLSYEIPLPNYTKRKKIIEYYLNKNQLVVKKDDPSAISPLFYEMFVTATEGFSCDALGDIINTAAVQAQEGFTPEHSIDSSFRCNLVDYSHHSLIESVSEIMSLPLFQAFYALGFYSENLMDQHIFSQFSRHKKLVKDIAEQKTQDLYRGYRLSDMLHLDLDYLGGRLLTLAGATALQTGLAVLLKRFNK